MGMPGFSAEASLYNSTRHYCQAALSGPDGAAGVGPTSYFEAAGGTAMETSGAAPPWWSEISRPSGVCDSDIGDERCSPHGERNPLSTGEIAPAACMMGECPAGQTCCNGTCCLAAQTCFNGCCSSGTQPLGGNTNFVFNAASRCQNISGLTVSVDVTQELFAADGFSIQLNAYNSVGPPTSWMQYVLMVNGDQVGTRIEYWDIAQFLSCAASVPPSLAGIICSDAMTFNNPNILGVQWWPAPGGATIPNLTLPSTNTIPANYALTIALQNDSSGNITGATFSVTDDMGNNFPLTLSVDQEFQFPIVAFQLNIVGYDNSQNTVFSSGGGLISYEAQNGLCVEGELPDLCSQSAASDTPTAENSNVTYGAISAPSCCGSSIQQSFAT